VKLIDEGDYFSEEEVRRRSPILYQLYVGRYKRYSPDPDATTGDELSKLLMERLSKTQAVEELDAALERTPNLRSQVENTEKELTQTELSDNIDELLVLMHQRFLAGQDHEFFDYKTLDYEGYVKISPRADGIIDPILENDREEAYYDSVEADDNGQNKSYTGEHDY
jgi:Coiled-coil domain containing protein (DUF2052)